jgi:hypothetical protein
MPTNDDPQQPLITDPERVTGEFAAITDVPAQVWERQGEQGRQFYLCEDGLVVAVGAPDIPTIPDAATSAQLLELGFYPCADPVAIAAVHQFLATWGAGDEV